MTLETQQSMGMSSVTEAPRWTEASLATRRVPALAVGRSAKLALVSADASQLRVEGRRPALAPLVLSPLVACLGTLPWLAPEPVGGVRLAVSGFFLLAAAGLARWSWPLQRQLTLSSRRPAPPGTVAVQPGSFRWVLEMRHAPNALHATYGVTLEPNDGAPLSVLENTDPERVLWQLSEVLRYWPGPVDCRWGLPAGAEPWVVEPRSGPRGLDIEGRPEQVVAAPAHRSLIWCTRLMMLFVLADLTFLVGSTSMPWAEVHPLSVVLAVLLGASLVALAIAVQTGRSQLCIGSRIRREDSLFGLRSQHGAMRLESVRGVFAVGLPSADRWHVLIDSSDGPLAMSVARHEAAALVLEAERAIASARTAAP
jgi:hypothetical protein